MKKTRTLFIIASVLCLCLAAIGAEASIVNPVVSPWGIYPVGDESYLQVICGTSVTLAVETDCTDTLTYQWMQWMDGSWNEIPEATSASYDLGPVFRNTSYRVYATDTQGTTRGLSFYIYVDNGLTAEPLDGQEVWLAQPYGSVELAVEASCYTGNLHYQWGKKVLVYNEEWDYNDWEFVPIEGATGNTFTVVSVVENDTYCCMVSDDYSEYPAGAYFYVQVENGLYARAVGETQFIVDTNESVTLVAAGGCRQGEVSFQWLGKTPLDSEYEAIEGMTGTSFTIEAVDTHMCYACAVTDPFGSVKWVYYDVAVKNGFEAHAIGPRDRYVLPNETVTLEVYGAADDGSVEFEWWSWEEDTFEGLDTSSNILTFTYTEYFPDVVYCTVTASYGEWEEFRFYLHEGTETRADIALDAPLSLTAGTQGGVFMFRFVPEWRGIYTFTISNVDDMNPVTALNESLTTIAEGDREGDNWVVSCLLQAGHTYFFTADPWDCSFEASLTGERADASGTSFVLPDSLKTIELEAFENTAASEVYIPDGCVSIGSGAFAACGNLRIVHIPNSVISINRSAFGSNVLIVCDNSWSYAMQFASENGLASCVGD